MKKLLSALMLSGCIALTGQNSVTTSTMVGYGHSDLLDTYLSAQDYSGWNINLRHEKLRLSSRWKDIVYQGNLWGYYTSNTNRADNGMQVTGFAGYSWSMMKRWRVSNQWRFFAGAAAMGETGFIYNLQNGNNPASGNFYLGIAATAMVSYKIDIPRPITLRYQTILPFDGAFFSPHYGQSYYEIFTLGNTDGIINFGSLHNRFDMDNILTADIPLGNAYLRIGYINTLRNSNIHDIKNRRITHSFLVGITREIELLNRRKNDTRKINNALF